MLILSISWLLCVEIDLSEDFNATFELNEMFLCCASSVWFIIEQGLDNSEISSALTTFWSERCDLNQPGAGGGYPPQWIHLQILQFILNSLKSICVKNSFFKGSPINQF